MLIITGTQTDSFRFSMGNICSQMPRIISNELQIFYYVIYLRIMFILNYSRRLIECSCLYHVFLKSTFLVQYYEISNYTVAWHMWHCHVFVQQQMLNYWITMKAKSQQMNVLLISIRKYANYFITCSLLKSSSCWTRSLCKKAKHIIMPNYWMFWGVLNSEFECAWMIYEQLTIIQIVKRTYIINAQIIVLKYKW